MATEVQQMIAILSDLLVEQRTTNELLRAAPRAAAPAVTAGAVATDADLDGKYGDPVVRLDPKRWTESGGESCVGLAYSACPAAFLDELAAFLEWSSARPRAGLTPEDAAKYARYDATDAARARGWAARVKAGVAKPAAVVPAQASRYGTSGHGASAKHALTLERDYPTSDGIPF